MHPEHVAKLFNSPKLAGIKDATQPPQPPKASTTSDAHGWTPEMDRQFEEAAATYEVGKSNVRLGGDTPLREIIKHPVGRIWHEAWFVVLTGGGANNAETAMELLPVLRATQSAFVLDLVFRALMSIHRNWNSALRPELYKELTLTLREFDVQKLEDVQ
jgi:hypothetical protein